MWRAKNVCLGQKWPNFLSKTVEKSLHESTSYLKTSLQKFEDVTPQNYPLARPDSRQIESGIFLTP